MIINKRANVDDNALLEAHKFLSRYRFSDIKQTKSTISLDYKHTMKIYDEEEVNTLKNKQERKSLLRKLLDDLHEEKNYKPVAVVTRKLINDVSDLRYRFPNFETVIDSCVKSLSLAMLKKPAILAFPPILLVGGAGVGKTRFLTELANTLKVSFHKTDLSSATAGFILGGSSTVWAEGKPGNVTNALRESQTANFIMLLDELDKANGDSRYNPVGCLFSLLEKKTAEEFIDEALQVKMNCSGIMWFASANTVETISSPILSRFTVFHIKDPSYEQQCMIAQSVYSDLLADNVWGQKFAKQLTDDVVEKLVAFSPRKQKAILIHACGEVAYECESKPKGLLKIQTQHIQLPAKQQKRSIGFL